MQSTSSPSRARTDPSAAAASSSAQTSVSSITRTGLDDDDDDDDDDEVCMINRHRELVDVDSGLVPDLLTADDGAAPPVCRLLHPPTSSVQRRLYTRCVIKQRTLFRLQLRRFLSDFYDVFVSMETRIYSLCS